MSRQTRPLAAVLLALAVAASPAAAVKRRAFVTSTAGTGNLSTWAGAGGASGLAAGDNICRARATAAGLPNAGTYRAWLSTSTTDAYCHVQGLTGLKAAGCGGGSQPGGGPWYLVNGVSTFTGPLADLTSLRNEIYRPVLLDENGSYVADLSDSLAWTGTTSQGYARQETCAGWTAGDGGTLGFVGSALASGSGWSGWNISWCDTPRRLLCLEPGASEAVMQPWGPGALAFVTSGTGTGDLGSWPQAGGATGIQAGDAICQSLARTAHLPAPESFVAWLSDDVHDASARLTLPTSVSYRRVDGYIVGSRTSLLGGTPTNSLHMDELGRYANTSYAAWTGTLADGTVSPGTTCFGWLSSSSGVTGSMGLASVARVPAWTEFSGTNCSSSQQHLYCFSNVVTLFWDGFDLTGDTSRWSSTAP